MAVKFLTADNADPFNIKRFLRESFLRDNVWSICIWWESRIHIVFYTSSLIRMRGTLYRSIDSILKAKVSPILRKDSSWTWVSFVRNPRRRRWQAITGLTVIDLMQRRWNQLGMWKEIGEGARNNEEKAGTSTFCRVLTFITWDDIISPALFWKTSFLFVQFLFY